MRAALAWQLAVTGVLALAAGLLGGRHAAISVVLGGGAVAIANLGYAFLVSVSAPRTVGATLRTLLRAEAVKVVLIVLELWLVFSFYRELVPLPLIAAMIVTVLIWPVALLYRD